MSLATTSDSSFSRNPIRMKLAPWQAVALLSPIQHLAMYGGIATGKSFTGSHFAIDHIEKFPHLTGFIGANSYDQLNQASLREMFKWLDYYRFEYVINKRPPDHWGGRQAFPRYDNILSVRSRQTGKPVHIFTRVLSDPDALRGIEFSWYWLDETRDTPENTHDVVIGRMREAKSGYARGLITTTTFGQDWSYKRFVQGADGRTYGAMHIPTSESLRLQIINQIYYDTLLKTYSPLMALQEMEAKHVNVFGGQAYYSASGRNQSVVAPWYVKGRSGGWAPTKGRPLVVGCDFNYSPAPCIWMIGQLGPALYNSQGIYWADCIHWFDEIVLTSASTENMTLALLARYPDFHYSIYGDVSGGKGTTSNAGEHDYAQMGTILDEAGAQFTIDYDQSNPMVRDRVENMNAKFYNASGQVHQTYNPERCPHFHGDILQVGWKPNAVGKLDDGGDKDRTHATDGAGYAVYKLLPPGRRAMMVDPVGSGIFTGNAGDLIEARLG